MSSRTDYETGIRRQLLRRRSPDDPAVSCPSTYVPQAQRIAQAMDKWQPQAKEWVRSFNGECVMNLSDHPFLTGVPLAGLPLEQIKCSLKIAPFTDCKTLADLQKVKKENPLIDKSVHLPKAQLFVYLTEDQMNHVNRFYKEYPGPAKPRLL